MHNSDAVCANDLLQCRAGGVDEASFRIFAIEPLIAISDQVRQLFGVGVGAKIRVSVLDELFFERLIILDDAVMDECDFSSGVEMRMRILVIDLSVCRPACVADSIRSSGWFLGNKF